MTILELKTKQEYKEYYIEEYCNKQIYTFSGILVKFYQNQFEHAFFESANHQKRDKSIFSIERAKRMNWIKQVLEDKNSEIYIGWDRDKKKYNPTRRVSIISPENYVVVINMITLNKAKFITAYPASYTTAKKIRQAPKWQNKNLTHRTGRACGYGAPEPCCLHNK